MLQGNLDSLGEEGYLLDVSEDSLVVRASEVPGIFYGLLNEDFAVFSGLVLVYKLCKI